MTLAELNAHLLDRIRTVRRELGNVAEVPDDAAVRFADVFDSMAMVEFLLVLGEDCGVPPERIEKAVERRFGTVGELAAALQTAGLTPQLATGAASPRSAPTLTSAETGAGSRGCWLAATAARLPDTVQPASIVNEQIGRPQGWLESHAGIERHRVWGEQDPLAAAAEAAHACLARAGVSTENIGALLTTSETPPLLAGLAGALHHRLGLPADTVALEIGGACTGFLHALWLARQLQTRRAATMVVAVEAPSRYLALQPGPAGEAAALFGDGAAACLLCSEPIGPESMHLVDALLFTDGSAADLIRVTQTPRGAAELHLRGQPLSIRALKAMGRAVEAITQKHNLQLADLAGVVMHGGNGRFPALFARHLGFPIERVHSQTAQTGNLGAASVPVAWASLPVRPRGPVVFTAVGAGLTWGAALLNEDRTRQE